MAGTVASRFCHGAIWTELAAIWATLALEAGVPVKVVSERLGHATTDIYSHVVPALDRHAADTVAASIFGL